jgi:hypothetical protein
MDKSREIGWQKYEDSVEEQLSSPLIQLAISHAMPELISEEEAGEIEKFEDMDGPREVLQPMIALPPEMASDFAIASSFDCWFGHTNFNITPTVKDILNKTEGVEILKICSRYRFFIGIGKMFDFKHVRKDLEKIILDKD